MFETGFYSPFLPRVHLEHGFPMGITVSNKAQYHKDNAWSKVTYTIE